MADAHVDDAGWFLQRLEEVPATVKKLVFKRRFFFSFADDTEQANRYTEFFDLFYACLNEKPSILKSSIWKALAHAYAALDIPITNHKNDAYAFKQSLIKLLDKKRHCSTGSKQIAVIRSLLQNPDTAAATRAKQLRLTASTTQPQCSAVVRSNSIPIGSESLPSRARSPSPDTARSPSFSRTRRKLNFDDCVESPIISQAVAARVFTPQNNSEVALERVQAMYFTAVKHKINSPMDCPHSQLAQQRQHHVSLPQQSHTNATVISSGQISPANKRLFGKQSPTAALLVADTLPRKPKTNGAIDVLKLYGQSPLDKSSPTVPAETQSLLAELLADKEAKPKSKAVLGKKTRATEPTDSAKDVPQTVEGSVAKSESKKKTQDAYVVARSLYFSQRPNAKNQDWNCSEQRTLIISQLSKGEIQRRRMEMYRPDLFPNWIPVKRQRFPTAD